MRLCRLLFILSACCQVFPAKALGDGLRLWHEGDWALAQAGGWRGNLGWKLVYDARIGKIDSGELKPQIRREVAPWLGAAATYKLSANLKAPNLPLSHTLELDLAPKWRLLDRVDAQCTQRLALARPAGGGGLRHRYHVIPKIEWPSRWLPSQTATECSYEAIYDLGSSAWIETKFTPLRLKFTGGPLRAWSIFYLQNDKRPQRAADWQRDHVLAFTLHH